MVRRFVCAALAALGTACTAAACSTPVGGQPIAVIEPTLTGSAEPDVTTSRAEPTTSASPTSTSRPSGTTSTPGPPLTIARRKTITTAPACAALVTPDDIGRVTGASATAEPEDTGFCGYTLTRSGTPAGVLLVVLTAEQATAGTATGTDTTFEGNTAQRLSTVDTTCDLRIALTDDNAARYRVLRVSLVLTGSAEPACATADKLARHVFANLPGG